MVYFLSDVHLGLGKREFDIIKEDRLIALLDSISSNTSSTKLYIVGDLFDYWFEYRKVMPKTFYRTLTKLRDLRNKGVEIEYIMGNHDFGHNDFFRKELDIRVYTHDIERVECGKRFYISHGDGKSYNDLGYKIIKKITRNKLALFFYNNFIHPDLGIWMASSTSKGSRQHTDAKDFGNRDGMLDFAKNKIDEGFDYVIMGHRHKLVNINYNSGYYINLGSWLTEAHYGVFDGTKFRLIEVPQ